LKLEELARPIFRIVESAADMTQAINHVRDYFNREGIGYVPMGTGNSKTHLPSTYRPVGKTCPGDCPLVEICQARKGRVELSQRRASADPIPGAISALTCMAAGACHGGKPARLHVSGDFIRRGDPQLDQVDWRYTSWLIRAAELVRRRYKIPAEQKLAFGYTQHFSHQIPHLVRMLGERGIVLLRSNLPVVGGAILYPREGYQDLKARFPHLKLAKCPAEVSDRISCANCGLCWEAYEKGLTIVFKAKHNKRGRVDLNSLLDRGERWLVQHD